MFFRVTHEKIFCFILEGKNILRKILHLFYFGIKNYIFPPIKTQFRIHFNTKSYKSHWKMLLQFLGEEGRVVSFAFVLYCEGVKRKNSPNSYNFVESYFRKKCDLTEIVANSWVSFFSSAQRKHSSWGSKLQLRKLSDDFLFLAVLHAGLERARRLFV